MSSAEQSFSSDSETDDDDDGVPLGPDEDERRSRSVKDRLPQRTLHPVDRSRSRDEVAELVSAAASKLASAGMDSTPQPPALNCIMHPYQLAGMRWALALQRCALSGILGDEMGLGKTLQAISVLAQLRSESDSGSLFLVIAPLSTLSGWASQFAEFCPSLTVITYTGSATERARLRRPLISGATRDAVVLASYEPVLADGDALKGLAWTYVVIDEAHRLKNRQSVLYRCLLDEMRLGSVPRLLLTGTPVQNEPEEFFNLLHFAVPAIYDDAAGWSRWVAQDGAKMGPSLWAPFLLRRLKADHLHLPPKVEATLRTPLTPLQREWYFAVLQRNRAALGAANARGLVNVLSSLRKCCNHPYLFAGAEPEPFEEGEHLVQVSEM